MNDSIATSSSEDKQFPVKVRKFTRDLRTKLSDKDKLERVERAAFLDGDITQREDEMSSAKKQAQAKIEELSTELGRIMLELRDGHVFVPAACEERFIYRLGVVQEVRVDTGEVLNERPMTDREKQPELPLGEGGATGEGAPAADADDSDDDDDDEDDGIVDDDYDPDSSDVDESPDTSVLDAKPGDAIETTGEALDASTEPELPTAKKGKGARGKGSKGGKGSKKGGAK